MTVIETILREPGIQALGWALLHFVWQGTLLAAAVAVALRALRHSAADVRYVVAVVALSLMATMPIVTGVQTFVSLRAQQAEAISGDGAAAVLPVSLADSRTAGGATLEEVAAPEDRSPVGVESLDAWLPVLVLGWMGGVAILALRLLGGWLWLHSAKSRGAVPAEQSLQAIVRRLTRTLHLRRPVALLRSPGVDVPTVIGWLKPTVLLPMSALSGLSPLQIEAILAHELAHVRRHDYLVNLLQALLETLLFYHPAVWWLSRRIRIEREHCCDDLAVSLCGDPVVYARALADLEEFRGHQSRLAMAASGGALLGRVRRLLAGPTPHAGGGPAWLAAGAAVLLMAGVVLGAVAGQPAVPEPEPPAAAVPVASELPQDEPTVHTADGTEQVPPPAPPPPPPAPAPPAPVMFDGTGQETTGNFTWTHNDDKIEVKYRGSFELSDDDTQIVRISPGGYVKLSDGMWLRGRSVEFSADAAGNVIRRYFVGSSERPFAPEAREWLAQTLPRFVRLSGFGARARVARILRQGGVPGVLMEISQIPSAYAKKVYFSELLKGAALDAAVARQVLGQAGREISSDYELATLLTEGAEKLLIDEASGKAYLEAAATVGSDHEMRRVLSAMLQRPLSASLVAGLLEAAKSLESDYEAASLLVEVVKRHSVEGQVRGPFFAMLATVGSAYEKGRVLQTLLRREDVSADTLLAVLHEAGRMGSSYEGAQVLLAAAGSHPVTGAVRDAYISAADRLGSYEQNQVLSALVRSEKR